MTQNVRVLVIDDDPGIRDSYREILSPSPQAEATSRGKALFDEPFVQRPEANEQAAYDVTLAERGDKGIAEVEKAVAGGSPFAVAFTDMKMPGLNGAETARQIWAVDPAVKIVIVTAYSEYTPDDIVQMTGSEGIFYLRKPFNPEEIRQFARALSTQWRLERERKRLASALEKANEALAEMNRDLQSKVEKQTSLLIQSEKMASIGILAAGVAHEINNPISFVRGNLSALKKYHARIFELLQKYREVEGAIGSGEESRFTALSQAAKKLREDGKLDFILKDITDLVEESLDGADRIRNIVKDMKTFARVDQAEFKHIDIHETIDAGLNILRSELRRKAEVVKEYGELPPVGCFPQKISQVFMNLLMNAVQAIEEKGTITVATRYAETGRRADDRYVEIRITDTGKGIPKDNLSKIFDPFFTTKPVGQGTGLGLSIAYDIIKAHGGNILVESGEGKGTTFLVRLPVEARL